MSLETSLKSFSLSECCLTFGTPRCKSSSCKLAYLLQYISFASLQLLSPLHRQLTGLKIGSIDDALKAMRLIHDKGPATVVISSSELGDSNHLIMLASHRKGTLCVYSRMTHVTELLGLPGYSRVCTTCFYLFSYSFCFEFVERKIAMIFNSVVGAGSCLFWISYNNYIDYPTLIAYQLAWNRQTNNPCNILPLTVLFVLNFYS